MWLQMTGAPLTADKLCQTTCSPPLPHSPRIRGQGTQPQGARPPMAGPGARRGRQPHTQPRAAGPLPPPTRGRAGDGTCSRGAASLYGIAPREPAPVGGGERPAVPVQARKKARSRRSSGSALAAARSRLSLSAGDSSRAQSGTNSRRLVRTGTARHGGAAPGGRRAEA